MSTLASMDEPTATTATIEFDDHFAIVKMYPPKPIRGMTVAESAVRRSP
jgi:hypothetical protein